MTKNLDLVQIDQSLVEEWGMFGDFDNDISKEQGQPLGGFRQFLRDKMRNLGIIAFKYGFTDVDKEIVELPSFPRERK